MGRPRLQARPGAKHHYTYQLAYVRCGKPRCGCMNGAQGHGPYWYAL